MCTGSEGDTYVGPSAFDDYDLVYLHGLPASPQCTKDDLQSSTGSEGGT